MTLNDVKITASSNADQAESAFSGKGFWTPTPEDTLMMIIVDVVQPYDGSIQDFEIELSGAGVILWTVEDGEQQERTTVWHPSLKTIGINIYNTYYVMTAYQYYT